MLPMQVVLFCFSTVKPLNQAFLFKGSFLLCEEFRYLVGGKNTGELLIINLVSVFWL
jgi:hypothetical protein